MASLDIEARRKRIEMWAKIGGLALAGFLFAPFALATIQGVVSLLVVLVVGLLVVNVGVPWFGVTIANWRLKALKAAAAANPIETLENQYADREVALGKIRENLNQSFAVLENLASQIKEHNAKFPNTPSQFADKYVKLKQLVTLRADKYKQAQANLQAFSELIDEKRSDWKIYQTMNAASKLANVGEDFQAKLLKDTAVNTVQDGLNSAFAELETSLLDEQTNVKPVVTCPPPTVKVIPSSSGPSSLDLGFDSSSLDIMDAVVVPAKRNK